MQYFSLSCRCKFVKCDCFFLTAINVYLPFGKKKGFRRIHMQGVKTPCAFFTQTTNESISFCNDQRRTALKPRKNRNLRAQCNLAKDPWISATAYWSIKNWSGVRMRMDTWPFQPYSSLSKPLSLLRFQLATQCPVKEPRPGIKMSLLAILTLCIRRHHKQRVETGL